MNEFIKESVDGSVTMKLIKENKVIYEGQSGNAGVEIKCSMNKK